MQLDLGRGAIFSGFDCPDLMRAPLRQKLEWSLSDVRDIVEDTAHSDWKWIIKPSVTNKGQENTKPIAYIMRVYIAQLFFSPIMQYLWMYFQYSEGADISVVGGNCWHEVLNVLEASPDIREWVMQRYIPDPLLIGTFIRAYILTYIHTKYNFTYIQNIICY